MTSSSFPVRPSSFIPSRRFFPRLWVPLILLFGCFFVDPPASSVALTDSNSKAAANAGQSAVPAAKSADPTSSRTAVPSAHHWASDKERVADARKRRGAYYANRLALFLKDTPARPKGGVVFLGDSITERLPVDDAFPGQNMINRGIGGDVIPGVIERLDVSVTDLQPRQIYLLVGINDLIWRKTETVQQLADQYKELLHLLKKDAPKARIVCESVMPVTGNWAKYNSKVNEFNALIKPLVEKEGFRYVDLHPWLANDKGELVSAYTIDGIHPSLEGNIAWLECILPPKEFMTAALNLAPHLKEERAETYPVAAVDPKEAGEFPGGRGRDQLIVYTPAYGHPTTGTNRWGYEVVVERGKVTKAGGNDSKIPSDGYVVSGHGKAATWVRQNLVPGTKVQHDAKLVRFTPVPETGESRGRQLRLMRYHILDRLPALAKEGRNSPGVRQAAVLLQVIHRLQGEGAKANPTAIEAFGKRVERL